MPISKMLTPDQSRWFICVFRGGEKSKESWLTTWWRRICCQSKKQQCLFNNILYQTTANRKLDDVNEGKLSSSQKDITSVVTALWVQHCSNDSRSSIPFTIAYIYNGIGAMWTKATHVVTGVDVLLQEEHNARKKVLSLLWNLKKKKKKTIIAPSVSAVFTLSCAWKSLKMLVSIIGYFIGFGLKRELSVNNSYCAFYISAKPHICSNL